MSFSWTAEDFWAKLTCFATCHFKYLIMIGTKETCSSSFVSLSVNKILEALVLKCPPSTVLNTFRPLLTLHDPLIVNNATFFNTLFLILDEQFSRVATKTLLREIIARGCLLFRTTLFVNDNKPSTNFFETVIFVDYFSEWKGSFKIAGWHSKERRAE